MTILSVIFHILLKFYGSFIFPTSNPFQIHLEVLYTLYHALSRLHQTHRKLLVTEIIQRDSRHVIYPSRYHALAGQ